MNKESLPTPPMPAWLRPGIWVRNKQAPYMGRAFIMFVDQEDYKGGFKYHLEHPYHAHSRDEGWQTGGTVFAAGLDSWEQTLGPGDPIPTSRAPSSETAPLDREAIGLFWQTSDGKWHFSPGSTKRGDIHDNVRPICVAYLGEEAK